MEDDEPMAKRTRRSGPPPPPPPPPPPSPPAERRGRGRPPKKAGNRAYDALLAMVEGLTVPYTSEAVKAAFGRLRPRCKITLCPSSSGGCWYVLALSDSPTPFETRHIAPAAAAMAAAIRTDLGSGGGASVGPVPRNDEQFIFVCGTRRDPRQAQPGLPRDWRPQQLLFVWRVMPDGARVPWAIVGPSAALLSHGRAGRGVYAWGKDGFTAGQLIGVFIGEVLGPIGSGRVAGFLREQRRLGVPCDTLIQIAGHLVSGKDHPFERYPLRASLADDAVLYPRDALSWPGMCAHLINNSDALEGAAPNVRVAEPGGVVVALRAMPPFDPDAAPAGADAVELVKANAASELFRSYGRDAFAEAGIASEEDEDGDGGDGDDFESE